MAVLHKYISFSFLLATIMGISAFIFNMLAVATPFWVRAWPRLFSKFDKIGLWQICLNGYVHPHDWTMTSYVGCWWVLSQEFREVRFWLLPAWFVFCQIFMTLALVLDLLICVGSLWMLVFRVRSERGSMQRGIHGKYGPLAMKLMSAFGFISMLFITVSCILIWIYSMDPYWMPNPTINKMSWSYGLALLAAFCNGFCAISYIYVHRGLFAPGKRYDPAPDTVTEPQASEM